MTSPQARIPTTIAPERDRRISSVLSSVATAELFLLALRRCFTIRRLSKRRAADELGLFRWLSAYSLSQKSSSFSSLSGLMGTFSTSEVFAEEAAKYSAGGRATTVADIVSATMWSEAVAMHILSNISALPRSVGERLRRLVMSADAVATFNVRSKRPTAANSAPSDDN